jgi:hypothetical protein
VVIPSQRLVAVRMSHPSDRVPIDQLDFPEFHQMVHALVK